MAGRTVEKVVSARLGESRRKCWTVSPASVQYWLEQEFKRKPTAEELDRGQKAYKAYFERALDKLSDLPVYLLGLPVLTVLPPWGTAIARWGKGDENRGRPPPESYKGKRLGIHQGQITLKRDGTLANTSAMRDMTQEIASLQDDNLAPSDAVEQVFRDAGRLLTIATLADALAVHDDHAVSLWANPGKRVDLSTWMVPGQVAWRLADHEPLDTPILLSGLQGIWRITHERRIAALQAQEKAGR